jgi:hypothetical protein
MKFALRVVAVLVVVLVAAGLVFYPLDNQCKNDGHGTVA